MLKTEYIDVLSVISGKLYASAANVMDTASRLIPANTFCIANLDSLSTKVLKSFNREKVMLVEGLVVDNEESYCALVTEHAQGPLIIDNNLTHPLTKDMDATEFVGGCSFIGVPIRNEKGEFYGSLCSFDHGLYQYEERDVELLVSLSAFFTDLLEMESVLTHLRTAEKKTELVLEDKKNLLAVLSHEIRTPMDGVIGMTSLLQTTELTEEQVLYVDVIEKSSNNLLSMMNQILDYSKIEAGTLKLELKPFHIRGAVDHVLQLFAADAEKKGIRMHAAYGSPNSPILLGDSPKVTQILTNLVSNALKFTERGEIGLFVRHTSDSMDSVTVSVEVRDSGIGLSICRQLTELMGGKIWLKETSEKGCIFAFDIPFKVEKVQSFSSKIS